MARPREDRTKVYLSIFLAFIMVSSILGVLFSGFSQNTKVTYEGVRFDLANDGWRARIDGIDHRFSLTPPDVEFLEFPAVDLSRMVQLGVASPYDDEFAEDIAYAQYELSEALSRAGIPVVQGFLTNASARHPVVTCEQASPLAPILLMRSANATSVRVEGDCIVVEAGISGVFLSYADLIAFKVLGVMS